MHVKIRTVKKTATASKKYSRWSTSGAKVEACSGNRGSLPISANSFAGADVAAQHDEKENSAHQGECGAGESHDVHGDGAVLAGGGIVMETEQQQFIGRAADAVLGGLDQAEANVARRIFHA